MKRKTLFDIAFYVVMVLALLVALAAGSVFVGVVVKWWKTGFPTNGTYTVTIQHYSNNKEVE
ncbi:hypothetical protein WS89_04000 [Burkholderia sp. MSMB1072]|uniref:hypothetical protein n=1 Tax=Burkholderia sp. MSMB1072 TaxID=1637871 RepID=UPI000754F2A9|nr:hypothetical protein [Burkholderia sp. MSMB1072]KVH64454.1 hypothetical protein WS89_04000 [Burkholderia sp. MSMB1072]